jgi:hypothetical protein
MKHLSALVLMLFFTNAANAFVLGGTIPGYWAPGLAGGGGTTITWSLVTNNPSCAVEGAGCTLSPLSTFMPAGYEAELVRAFDAWSAVADVTFVKVPDGGEAFNAPGSSGDIRVAGQAIDGIGGTLAHGFFPPVNGDTAAGDIHFDSADTWKIGFGGSGFDIFQVFAHELGHALGLGHTTVPNSLMNPNYTETFSGLQADDIAGIQSLYGAANSSVPTPQVLWLLIMGFVGFVMRNFLPLSFRSHQESMCRRVA